MELLRDLYAFRPTGSTCCAMVDFIHHSTLMLENNSYIRWLFIDFSKAFWLIMESDLHPLSDANVIFTYADDTNLLVPENTDCTLAGEFSHIKRWADINGLIINFDKTKELVLHHPHVTRHNLPQSLAGIEQVVTVRLLGVNSK